MQNKLIQNNQPLNEGDLDSFVPSEKVNSAFKRIMQNYRKSLDEIPSDEDSVAVRLYVARKRSEHSISHVTLSSEDQSLPPLRFNFSQKIPTQPSHEVRQVIKNMIQSRCDVTLSPEKSDEPTCRFTAMPRESEGFFQPHATSTEGLVKPIHSPISSLEEPMRSRFRFALTQTTPVKPTSHISHTPTELAKSINL